MHRLRTVLLWTDVQRLAFITCCMWRCVEAPTLSQLRAPVPRCNRSILVMVEAVHVVPCCGVVILAAAGLNSLFTMRTMTELMLRSVHAHRQLCIRKQVATCGIDCELRSTE
jgi:hypothetical protein